MYTVKTIDGNKEKVDADYYEVEENLLKFYNCANLVITFVLSKVIWWK